MMKCNKCGATLLMEQIPEVHISEAELECNQPGCDGKATYRNNPITNTGVSQEGVASTSILMENQDPGEHHG